MELDPRMKAWCERGFDPESAVNPPPNSPKLLPPHIHSDGFDAQCGLCLHLRQLAGQEGPARSGVVPAQAWGNSQGKCKRRGFAAPPFVIFTTGDMLKRAGSPSEVSLPV